MSCVNHTPNTLTCSCGWSRLEGEVSRMDGFDIMSEESLKALWGAWDRDKRELYKYLLESARPFEVKDRQAASWAAGRVAVQR